LSCRSAFTPVSQIGLTGFENCFEVLQGFLELEPDGQVLQLHLLLRKVVRVVADSRGGTVTRKYTKGNILKLFI
jgi:hypothetical protein